jgi:hypothetical protein
MSVASFDVTTRFCLGRLIGGRLRRFLIGQVASTAIRVLLSRAMGTGSSELVLERGSWRLAAEQHAYFKFTAVRDPVDR